MFLNLFQTFIKVFQKCSFNLAYSIITCCRRGTFFKKQFWLNGNLKATRAHDLYLNFKTFGMLRVSKLAAVLPFEWKMLFMLFHFC